MKELKKLGHLPGKDGAGPENYQKQVQWYLTLDGLLQDLIELGDRNDDLGYAAFNPDVIRGVLNLFPPKLHLLLTCLPGTRREKLANIKEKLIAFRSDAQVLDKERQGDGGGKYAGSGGSKSLGIGGGGGSKTQTHATFKKPQRYDDCRICGALETEGESGLYEGHLSTWPTGCPKFIQMSADERDDVVFKGRFCRSCLSPEAIFTSKQLNECNIRKKA